MNLDYPNRNSSKSPTPSDATRTPQSSQSPTPAAHSEKKRFSGVLKDLPKFTWTGTPASTVPSTPATEGTDEYESGVDEKKERRRRKRRKAEIWVRKATS